MAKEFLEVIDADDAHRRFRDAVRPEPLGEETVALADALGRVLARDVTAGVDVPGFDRSNVDGYAVRAEDTFGCDEASPARLTINDEELTPGCEPDLEVTAGSATPIATGGMIPRGADAVVMLEETDRDADSLQIFKPVVPGGRISFAGGDIARGETVLRRGTPLTARETGTLAAIGATTVAVHRRPRVAIFSTGDEIVDGDGPMRPGLVFDSNRRLIADTLRELGCEPVDLGIVADEPDALEARLREALEHDAVVLSGGTSKGGGDHGPAAVAKVADVICHGVAVKPGKPICLAAASRKPIALLPGFPTSAVFTFHEFVVPILAELAGAPQRASRTVEARVPMRLDTERGRAEFILVNLLESDDGFVAYPLGKGSGSVTTFAQADGFVTLARHKEFVEENETVAVRLLGRELTPAAIVFVGSHCLGLDYLVSRLRDEGWSAKTIAVGSQGGLHAARRGECDVAGIHLCNEAGEYNEPFLEEGMELVAGYGRMQGVVSRRGEPKPNPQEDRMINRNRGSGTRVLVDELLGDARPPGYHFEARSHNAVAAAVAQGRADWGIAIRSAANMYELEFDPLREERYDFVVPTARFDRLAVAAFRRIIADAETRRGLAEMGFLVE